MFRSYSDVVIPISGTDSATTSIPAGYYLAGVITPAALTGANVSLKGHPNTNAAAIVPVYNAGSLYSIAMGINRLIMFDPSVTKGLSIFAFVSDGTEAAARTLTAIYLKD
jgi:hypothetical protein